MPSSQRKLESARANGAKSRGPVTPHGKHTSSLNAVRHALLAKTVVLTNESGNSFQLIFQAYLDHLRPFGDIEMDLVEQMAVAKWKERRGWSIHTATLNHRMNTQEDQLKAQYELLDDDMRMAIAFSTEANDCNALALLLRYEATHRRTYARAFQHLLALQAIRKQARAE